MLDLTMEELKARELVPFQALIDVGIELIMTAHIVFPKIDPENQATMSKRLLNDLLRRDMGFKGVVIADALGMAATVDKLSQRATVSKAINAGLDIFCVAGDTVTIKDAVKMAELLHEALERGEITRSVLDQSQDRIDRFIEKLTQHPVTELDAAKLDRHHALAEKLEACSPWSSFDLSLSGFE